MREAVILSAVRTPTGKFLGSLKDFTAPQLGAIVVKEAVTRMQSPDTQHQATTVGKAGFAPSEQLQTGQAYPSSDLYALAVTAVVLLTGRDAGELYNDRMLTWDWQNYAPEVSPRLAQVLNRMLSHKPDDRYQSVREVVEPLQPEQAAG